ncbi:protein of unknown function DUF1555 [Geobacter metallireducens RCH3]|uniref:PEP motif-containing protein, putative exosortase substrate n=1 Tax=Geobacter metallireducens (strain ATCC 53774 / DSM 7210 / GS-15) TaxID=269799 RepID=Q39XN4_GEOMG|nr:PEP-CTERM sorting domain-containing protein [Geobacter metallireducens]ABB30990.1 PEP motif-containing protein, putative exosortase substrate [Geobacter metallireducens GS-15]EHP84466.1 protein of unknown function DUF1555 [Geobacter metallireducens RCH3]
MKRILFALALVASVATSGWAITYTGSLASSPGGGLLATLDWAGITTAGAPNSSLSWTVDDTTNTGLWTYNYIWTGTRKGLSHIVIEVSDTFTKDNIMQISSGYDGDAPKTYSPSDASNDGLPADIWGIKWNAEGTVFNFSIVTDREPMWGDVYARDGKTGGSDVYAYNTGFGFDTAAVIADGNAFDQATGRAWALVPDTENGGGGQQEVVPEPGTIMLLGTGLIGLALYGRRRMK